MKKKFKIIFASTGIAGGKPLKLKEGEMLLMNSQGNAGYSPHPCREFHGL